MAETDAQLLVQISATTELLRSQLARADAEIGRFQKGTDGRLAKVDKSFSNLGKSVSSVKGILSGFAAGAVAGLVGVLGGSLIAVTKNALDYAGSLGEVSDKMGVTTKFLQEFRYAATQAGASTEEADAGLTKLNLTLGKAQEGQKAAISAFTSLGVAITDANGKGRTADAVFADVATAIAKIPDPARQAAAAQQIFGKGFAAILPLLKQGGAGFNALANEAQRFGLVLSDSAIKNADEASDKIATLNEVLKTEIASSVANNAQAILAFANSIVAVVNAGGQLIQRVQQLSRNTAIANANPGGNPSTYLGGLVQIRNGRRLPKGGRGGGRFDPTGQFGPGSSNVVDFKPIKVGDLTPIPSGGGGSRRSRSGGPTTPKVDPITQDVEATMKALDERISDFGAVIKDEVGTAGDEYGRIVDAMAKASDVQYQNTLDEIDLRETSIRDQAYLYETLMTQGTKGFLKTLEAEGIRIIAEMVARLIGGQSLTAAFGAASKSSPLGSIFGIASSFGGFFANGGRPPMGKVSVVGERGPELFVPKVPGTIIPNGGFGGGGGINLTVNAPGATAETVMMIRRELAAAAPQLVAAATQSTVKTLTRPRI